MGKTAYDIWTLAHFASGVISYLLIKGSTNVSDLVNFMLSNIVHIYGEYNEIKIEENGNIKNSNSNQIVDIIVFVVGWFLAYSSNLKIPINYILIAWVLVLLEFCYELIIRE